MYNVGFGDAFLVTVHRDGTTWRMLVDCGAHSHGQVRPMKEVVADIVADLAAESEDGVARLDVVVATHRHRDHIVGFADPRWEEVEVGEVWMSFVEDEDDPDAQGLRGAQDTAAQRLLALIEERTHGLDPAGWPRELAMARSFAMNSLTNQEALDRLLGENGQGFRGRHSLRFVPSATEKKNQVSPMPGLTIHFLGPSRDPEMLKRMDPPRQAGWRHLGLLEGEEPGGSVRDLFAPRFRADESTISETLVKAQNSLNLSRVTNDDGVLAASARLERVLNNTSVFLVVDVAGTKLLFPGDAQHGAWDHVLGEASKAALVNDCAFYKIGHHGSHNATPKNFVRETWREGGYAMLPWGLVKRWQDTIPKRELIDALGKRRHTIIRIDDQRPEPDRVRYHGDVWSELVLDTE